MLIKPFTDVAASVERHKRILSEAKAGMDEDAARRFFIKAVNANPDIIFDDKGHVLPSKSGWKLIHAMDKKFPEREITDRFLNVITMPDKDILDWALAEQFNVIRTGFTERGLSLDEAQTNGEHVNNMLGMADDNIVQAKIVLHDMVETETTDFSKPVVQAHNLGETKVRLEKMGAAILFQREPILFQLWMEYEDKATALDYLVKELDNLEHLVYVNDAMQNGVPNYMHPSFVEAIHDTIAQRMRHPHYESIARDTSMRGPAAIPRLTYTPDPE